MQIGPLSDGAVAGESKYVNQKKYSRLTFTSLRSRHVQYKPLLSDTRRPIICLMMVTSVALTCLLKAPFAILKTR